MDQGETLTPVRIVIHCSDNGNGSLMSGEDIRRYHKAAPPAGRGWSDIGYHGVIETSGDYFGGRPETSLGAHVECHNDGSLGVCLIGRDKFTPKQFETLRWILDKWTTSYKIDPSKILGHYQFDTAKRQGKTCPNVPIEAIIYWYLNNNEAAIYKYILGVSASG